MNCPKCDGETREAADIDTARDEIYELGWFYCLDPECGWSNKEDQELEDRRDLERELLR